MLLIMDSTIFCSNNALWHIICSAYPGNDGNLNLKKKKKNNITTRHHDVVVDVFEAIYHA